MGRRKQEPPHVHRGNIAAAAQLLFMEKGMKATSMDEIAKAAGYSKATLYVYFKNKEEIIDVLVLESMQKLQSYLENGLAQPGSSREKYHFLCQGLVEYQREFPFYFQTALDTIYVDYEHLQQGQDAFLVGESINRAIAEYLKSGMAAGEIRRDIEIVPTLFAFWGMLSGLIQMAVSKEEYIGKALGMRKESFLQNGFATLYRAIAADGKGEGKHNETIL